MNRTNIYQILLICILALDVIEPFSILATANPKSSSLTGISDYQITQGVTYDVEINYTLTHNVGSQNYYFKVARLNDRGPNSTLTQYCPPYQESKLLYNSISGYDSLILDSHDQYNNTYDLFNATLSTPSNITLSQKYTITLNAITFGSIDDSDIGIYDTSDKIFELYCNKSEPFYNITDPDLVSASNSIVNSNDSAIVKAQKIAIWVADWLTYDGTLPALEKGASWAYDNQRGDCSEYSTLMVTLLRIQHIPARKVTGFLLSNDLNLKPQVGQVFNFHENSMLGHAWVEYYIPNIGWIACEPQNPNYYKKIDYLRFNVNIGDWFFLPPSLTVTEFPYLPSPVFSFPSFFTEDYDLKITVLSTNFNDLDLTTIIVISVIVGVIIAVIVIIIKTSNKRKKLSSY